MNWLDLTIVIILVVSIIVGLKTGLIKAVLSLAGIVIGIFLAGRFYLTLATRLTFITDPTIAKVAAFAIILGVVVIIASIIAAVLKWAASAVMLGWINHLGGAAFGLVWGALMTGAALAAWVHYLGMNQIIGNSTLSAIMLKYFPLVLSLLPGEFSGIRSFF